MPEAYRAIVRDAWSVKRFEYGYAHTHVDPMSFACGGLGNILPWVFLETYFGVRNPGLPQAAETLRLKWLYFARDSQVGGPRYSERLRDVFPENYLVDSHLGFRLGEQSLGEWITASPARGLLTSLEPGLWCWSVQDDVIPQVRSALEPSGLLVAPGGC